MKDTRPTDLYPPIEPHDWGFMTVDGHQLYWEVSGNPRGVPVAFVHGGPGAGTAPAHRRFFDPEHWRIVLFDQRGCGRSQPTASLEANTTWTLVADMERLRAHLGIERWLLFGGSWGSTLALAYGQSHPERCLGFVLRGVFLFRADEVEWFLTGMARFFPESWQLFAGHLPPDERGDLLGSYYRRLTDPDPAVRVGAARAWCAWEEACARLIPRSTGEEGDLGSLAMARIEAHYMVHRGFMAEGQLLANLPRIAHLPAAIVQGRYDMVCPVATAHELAEAWPGCRLSVVPDAGHSAMEPGTRLRLVAAVKEMKRLV
jgi:proline iminopeptidase